MPLPRNKPRTSAPVANGDIAITGMACIFPGAPNLQSYWQNIVSKVDSVSDPPEDWGGDLFFDPESRENDRIYCKRGGYLGDLACFDPLQYGVMPSSLDGSEPDHFLALRVAHEALADAGLDQQPIDKGRVAVILGRGTYVNRGYTGLVQHGMVLDQTIRLLKQLHPEHTDDELKSIKQELKAGLPPFNAEVAPGLVPNIVSGRIANRLDFMGPNYTVDAACASSLIAVDLGMKDLRAGKCDIALVGGVHASTPPPILMIFCQLNALSRKGRIRPFDKDADGTLLGEGVGIIVLKRLDDAEAAHDRIYAVLKAVGTASDGRALGLLAPRVDGEELALRRAYEEASISPRSLELIEAHGTGTPVGDATEIDALTRVFGSSDVDQTPWCAVGSVKSMISHLIPAAGVAGLIKVALALHHKVLPPTLHVDEANAKLLCARTPFYLNTETRPWIHRGKTPRRAGVNAFGFGGINAHAILEEHISAEQEGFTNLDPRWDTELCVFQAATRQELLAQGAAFLHFLKEHEDSQFRDVAYTLNSRIRDVSTRLAIVASSTEDARQKLEYALKRLGDPSCNRIKEVSGIYFFQDPLFPSAKFAFVFPGEGSQYTNMLSDLCIHFPEARAWFDLVDQAFATKERALLPSQVIYPPPSKASKKDDKQLWQMDIGAESVFAANQALLAVLSRLNIRPDAVVGHSTGEYSALLAAGVLRFKNDEQLIQSILSLHNVYEEFAAKHGIPEAVLLAVGGAEPAAVSSLVEQSGGELHLAMDNCPHQVILCGSKAAIQKSAEQLRSKGAICSELPFQRAYHTSQFRPFCELLKEHFSKLSVAPPTCDLYSCVTAELYPESPAAIRDLAVEHWERPVRFRPTIEAMYDAGISVFVEVGPRGNLTAFIDDILAGRPHLAVAADLSRRRGTTQLNHMLGLLLAHGAQMQFQRLYASRTPSLLSESKKVVSAIPAPSRSVKLAMGLAPLRLQRDRTISRTTLPGAVDILASSVPPSNGKSLSSPHEADRPGLQIVSRSPAASVDRRIVSPVHPRKSTEHPPTQSGEWSGSTAESEARAQVVQQHLLTMERFLATQQGVMQAFLDGPMDACTSPVRSLAKAFAPTQEKSNNANETSPFGLVPPVERVSMEKGESTPSVIERVETPSAPTEEVSPPKCDRPQQLQKSFLKVISEKTGYPVEMLDPKLNLEADLGIDSIKRIEILGGLQRMTGIPRAEDMEAVSKLKTIQQVVNFLTSPPDGDAPVPSRTPISAEDSFPLLHDVAGAIRDNELNTTVELNLDEHLFLRDHTLGTHVSDTDPNLRGLAVLPLTFSMEIMAEAAAALCPGHVVIRMEHIRAHRWIKLEPDRFSLSVSAKRSKTSPSQCQVCIRALGERGTLTREITVVEGTVVLADRYPEAVIAGEFSLSSPHSSKWKRDELYSGYMFHGPTLRGVAGMELCGDDGAVATLQALPSQGLLLSVSDPEFLVDPVMLDAAGQVVAYWLGECAQHAFHVFPFELEALEIYGPSLKAGLQTACRAKVSLLGDSQLRSDIDLIQDGKIAIRMLGWRDKRFHLPERFYRLRTCPKQVFLSDPWTLQAPEGIANGLFCSRLEELSAEFLESSAGIWQSVLAHLVLSERERSKWRELNGAVTRRIQWLLGRVAAKDAVRMLLAKKHGLEICPADVEITQGENGHPGVSIIGHPQLPNPICVSIAHIEGVGVAAAAEREEIDGVGIDIERMSRVGFDFQRLAFVRAEQGLISKLDPSQSEEWALRLWCAKEAVAKALGDGVPGSPTELVARRIELGTGKVELAFSHKSAKRRERSGHSYFACTLRERDLVAATSILVRSRT